MYIPKHNAARDPNVIRALVRDYGFGTMIVPRADGPSAALMRQGASRD